MMTTLLLYLIVVSISQVKFGLKFKVEPPVAEYLDICGIGNNFKKIIQL
jgi:hypothetical protein